MDKVKSVASLFIDTFKKWGEDRAIRMAAALSYYGLFSAAPLVFILTAIGGSLIERAVDQEVPTDLGQILEGIFGPDVSAFLLDLAEGAGESATISEGLPLISLISIGILLWGASNIFNYMHEVLNTMWGVEPLVDEGVFSGIRRRLLAFAIVFIAGVLLILYLVAVTLLSFLVPRLTEILPEALELLPDLRVLQIGQYVVLFLFVTLLFGAIYKILPDVELGWRDVFIGAAFTSLLFGIGTFVLGIYFTFYSATLYGAAGSVVVLLLWFYYTSQIFLYGAEFTYVYATRYGSRTDLLEDEDDIQDDAVPGDDAGSAGEAE